MIGHCSLSWTITSRNDDLNIQTENFLQDIKDTEEKQKEVTTYSVEHLPTIPVWVPYKSLTNLAELPVGIVHAVSGIGYGKHYHQDNLVVKLDNGMQYQAGEFLDACKDRLLDGCKIIIEKLRLDKARRKSAVCKIVQKGDWSGLVDYKQVPMLSSKNKDAKVLDVKTVKPLSHQGGVLTVIPGRPKNAERRGARSKNASMTAATQWHRHWTRWDRIERRVTARTLSKLKTNTVAWHSLGVLIERRGDAVRSP